MSRHVLLPFAVWLFVFLLYLCTAGGHLYSPDARVQYKTARALATFQGVAIEPLPETFGTMTGRDGREYSQYGIGLSLATVPFYWLGLIVAAVLPSGADVVFHHMGAPIPAEYLPNFREELGPSLANQAIGALLAVGVFLFVRREFSSARAGLFAALLFATCTVTWPHCKDLFSEPLAALGLLLAYYWGDLARRSITAPLPPLLAGVACAVALLTRLDSALFLPGVLVCALWPYGTARHIVVRRASVLLFPVFLALLFVAWYNWVRFGNLWATGYADAKLAGVDLAPRFSLAVLPYGLFGQIFSPGKSLFVYSLVLVAGAAAFHQLYRRNRALGTGLLVGMGVFFLAMSCYEQWPGGWCWGPRHIYQLTPLLALPLGWYASRESGPWTPVRSTILGFLVVAALTVQIPGLAISFMDSHRMFIGAYGQEQSFRMIYDVTATPAALHWQILLRHGAQLLDVAWLRWLLLGTGAARYLALLLPAATVAAGCYLWRLAPRQNR